MVAHPLSLVSAGHALPAQPTAEEDAQALENIRSEARLLAIQQQSCLESRRSCYVLFSIALVALTLSFTLFLAYP